MIYKNCENTKTFETEESALFIPKFNAQNCNMMENVVSRFKFVFLYVTIMSLINVTGA
jgi:hypothetical protein